MMKWSITEYDTARHEEQVHLLWTRSFPQKWRVVRRRLNALFSVGPHSVVAMDEGRVVGFAGTIPQEHAMAAIVVDEPRRGRGIGSELFVKALDNLRRTASRPAVIGGTPMLWTGVPVELEAATTFFRNRGCSPTLAITDLYRELDDYEYPAHLEQGLSRRGIRVGLAGVEDREAVLAFQRDHFPEWLPFYAEAADRKDYGSIGCVKAGTRLLGTILIGRPGTAVPGEHWDPMAEQKVGSFGVLGIAPVRGSEVPGLVSALRELAKEGLSLGYALSAFATQCLKDSGARVCFLNYAVADALFRKLGYRDWATYQRFEKAL